MNNSTPFSRWSEQGLPDPHGELYGESYDTSIISAYELIERLSSGNVNIMVLTLAKERLRSLSRKVYNLYPCHTIINEERFNLTCGDQTDDELANSFYIYETYELLQAGAERMRWLCDLFVKEDKRFIETITLADFYIEIRDNFDNTCVLPTCDIKPVHYNKNTRSKFKKRNKSNK